MGYYRRTPEGEAREGSGIGRGAISLHPAGHSRAPQPGEGGPASEAPGYAWTRGPSA
ncbi:hypothetical protein [Amycolatopsis sp. cg9]|uniref:hypothetical protein n=1 Tax=Amycolatopsis sp. cg9 TaxID=3238801 RepID=UPI00352510A0